ncbi:MAG: transposase [Pseudomonadota bacterium]
MRKSFTQDEAVRLLAQIEGDRAAGRPVHRACRAAGIADTTYYAWRKRYRKLLRGVPARQLEQNDASLT